MNCDWTEKISSLIDGELPSVEAREVERHLLNCGECQQVRADFLNLRSQITSFALPGQSEVQRQALAKILKGQNTRVGPGRRFTWGFSPAAVAFAGLILVAAIIGLLFYQRFNQREAPREQLAVQTATPVPSPGVISEKPKSESKETPKKDEKESETPKREPKQPAPAPPRAREPKPGEQFATITPDQIRSADAETMTAMHLEKSETLLRSFRNLRLNDSGTKLDVTYERKRAQQLVYQNMMLRREADKAGDVQVAGLLESLEPILLDIANLPDRPDEDSVRVINQRVERKNIVALLQVNSMALARALD